MIRRWRKSKSSLCATRDSRGLNWCRRERNCLGTTRNGLASLLLVPLYTCNAPDKSPRIARHRSIEIAVSWTTSLGIGACCLSITRSTFLRHSFRSSPAMSKLSPALKSLINAAHSRPGPVPAPPRIQAVYQRIQEEATERKLGRPSWLGISTAATMTMNSPESMIALYNSTSASRPQSEGVAIAEFMREIGLKCIGFNGVRIATSFNDNR
jgi:hypothetical protein